jgi:hypothetical protein
MLQVALKRQQAAEDAIALGLRAMATGRQFGFLPPGPVFAGVSPDNENVAENSTQSAAVTAQTSSSGLSTEQSATSTGILAVLMSHDIK